MTRVRKVAILFDYTEEGWRSMDLVGHMLVRELFARYSGEVAVKPVRPRFARRFTRLRDNGYLFNADRVLNRFVDYPRFLRERVDEFDLFHIIDHTYSHLAGVVGPHRCVVTCHDVDAFRPVTGNGDGGGWIRAYMARRIADGFGRVAAISCDSSSTRDDVLVHRLAPSERLTVNPNGVAEVFTNWHDPTADATVCQLLGAPDRDQLEIVNVGSTIPRKRIDVLLRVLAALRRLVPGVRLIRVGGMLTTVQRKLMRELNLSGNCVVELPFLTGEVLAGVYRRAALAVFTAEYEGFGLPVLEAMACGTPVVLSDIAAFREIGGPAATFCPVPGLQSWLESILSLAKERCENPRQWCERVEAGARWAGRFTWKEHADRAVQLYRTVRVPLP
jgi:glycosyltransferase involved in cell wall biosynthesis